MLEKCRKPTLYILFGIVAVASLFLIDRWVLPQKEIADQLIGYRKLTLKRNTKFGSSEMSIGYHYYTEKGHEFTVEADKKWISTTNIRLKQTLLFKNISSAETDKHDYSSKLISGINGVCLLFIQIIVISSIISIVVLIRNKNISKNKFQNILLFNGFMLFITLYLVALYN